MTLTVNGFYRELQRFSPSTPILFQGDASQCPQTLRADGIRDAMCVDYSDPDHATTDVAMVCGMQSEYTVPQTFDGVPNWSIWTPYAGAPDETILDILPRLLRLRTTWDRFLENLASRWPECTSYRVHYTNFDWAQLTPTPQEDQFLAGMAALVDRSSRSVTLGSVTWIAAEQLSEA